MCVYQQIDVEKYQSEGPSTLHSMTELPRVLLEMSSLAYTWPWLGSTPRGDGHSVLVLPGFTGGDESTFVLRRYLGRIGYRALPWGLGRNTGTLELQERLVHHFDSLTQQCDGQISLVGQSLGGVYARELARQFPERVRQVVTLGSPSASAGPDTANPLVIRLFEYVAGMSRDEVHDQMRSHAGEPPPVPSTAIYSKSDGVVHWSSCLEYRGPQSENVEVLGSHTGMAMNALVFHVLADRLGQAPGAWRPFERTRGCRGLLFPEPEPTLDPPATNCEVTSCAN